ncbi:MAG TPA: hypothetical protein VGB83_12090 [Actinomycetota bacterium]
MERRPLVCALLALVVAGALPVASRAATPCGSVAISLPAFARGSDNLVSWTVTGQGSSVEIEISTTPDTTSEGAFASTVQSFSASASGSPREIHGLAERTHYFHARATKPGACTPGPWSTIKSSTQDATPPVITITSQEQTSVGAVFLNEDATIVGTAADEAGGAAVIASGAKTVTVTLANTTPVLGAGTPPDPLTVSVAPDGNWSATFEGISSGTYVAEAAARDNVGNVSDPATLSFVLVAA